MSLLLAIKSQNVVGSIKEMNVNKAAADIAVYGCRTRVIASAKCCRLRLEEFKMFTSAQSHACLRQYFIFQDGIDKIGLWPCEALCGKRL